MATSIKVEGMRELQRKLGELEKRATRRAVARRALKKASAPMLDLIRSYAPHKSGRLELNIVQSSRAKNAEAGNVAFSQVMRSGGSRGDAVAALRAARRSTSSLVQLFIGPTNRAFYAWFQEFGTEHHAPDPFMRPGWDAEWRPTLRRIGEELGREIEKSVARQAARRGG